MKFAFAGTLLAVAFLACSSSPPPTMDALRSGYTRITTTRSTGATVTVYALDGVTIHSYTSPEGNFSVSTHIIESANALVLIDAQMLMTFANDFRAYAASLRKPIDRILITHAHPDHYLGMEAFAEMPSFALAEVKREIAFTGEDVRAARRRALGDVIAARSVPPRSTLATGKMMIDGVRYEFEKLEATEAETMLITRLPDFGVMSVGDAASNGVHLFLANTPGPWAEQLRRLGADPNFTLILPGHGLPGDRSMFGTSIAWLTKAEAELATAKSGAEFKSAMLEAFPDLGLPAAIDFFLPVLFPNEAG